MSCWCSRDAAERTGRGRTPTGTCSSGTPRPFRPSQPRWSDSRQVQAIAVIEVADLAERHQLSCAGELTAHWIYPCGSPGAGSVLVTVVRALDFSAGQVHAFVHGEAGWVRAIRPHLLVDRGVSREWLSISGYWRRGLDEDGFRAEKAKDRGELLTHQARR